MDKKALYSLLRKYLDQNCTPDEKKMIDEWLELLHDSRAFNAYTSGDLEIIHHQIWEKIHEQTHPHADIEIPPKKPRRVLLIMRWATAACLLGAVALGVIYFSRDSFSSTTDHFSDMLPASGTIQNNNTSNKPVTLQLEDNSKVILQPGARFSYPVHFTGDKREVYLDGEAFFNIARNSRQPFFIYHNKLVTHVLGTSFTINTRKLNKQVEISVLSGRVEVSENKTLLPVPKGSKENGVLLTPNQKVIYSEENRMFVASIADKPVPLQQQTAELFEFENAEMSRVMKLLSDTYAIEIVLENENISKCTFTGAINDKDLFDKLDIICRSINCSYELRGTTILVKGIGCE